MPRRRAFVVRRTQEGSVEVDGQEQATDDRDVPYLVSRLLTLASIRRRSGSCVMLHAAGLATDDGGTVALVAGSGTGKTTAGRLLGRSLGYVSDETVTVEHDLTVRPYPKPLSIVTDPTVPTGKHEESPDDLGLRRAAPALRLSAVAVLERRDDVGGPVLEPIGLVEAMNLVLPQSSALPSVDRPLDRLARVLAIGHGPYRLTYRNIEDCVGLVTDLAHVGRGHAIGDVTWTWFDGHGHVGAETPVPDDLGPSTVVCPHRVRRRRPVRRRGAPPARLGADHPPRAGRERVARRGPAGRRVRPRRRRRGRARPPPRRRGDRRRHRADDDRGEGACTSCDACGGRTRGPTAARE